MADHTLLRPSLQDEIQCVLDRLANRKVWEWPYSLEHSVLFLASEVGELADALMRQHIYHRNNDRNVSVAEELGDVALMAYVSGILAGVDVDAQVRHKLEKLLGRI